MEEALPRTRDPWRGPWGRCKRFMVKYAAAVLLSTAALIGGLLWSIVAGYAALPGKVSQLEAQIAQVAVRQVRDSVRADSSYRVQAGMLSILCFGLSDEAFDKAKHLCGEAFYVSRVIADERLRQNGRAR